MAEQNAQDSQEKTEEPTPRRLSKAREQGQVARSRELNTTGVLLAGSGALFLAGAGIADGLADIMTAGLALDRPETRDLSRLVAYFASLGQQALVTMGPLLVAVLVAALVFPAMLGGVAFSTQAMAFKWEKLDPVRGLKRVFGPQGLMELVKALAKFVVVLAVTVALLWTEVRAFLSLGRLVDKAAMADAVWLIGWNLLVVSAAMIIIAAVDVPFQVWNHKRQLRMTKQQVKDENKDTEGKPEVKQKIRQLQMETAMRRMMGEVPKADVIVTNPTHFAVALRYDASTMAAPRLVAKGKDRVALRIREVGEAHGVAVVGAPALARAVYFTTELDREVPASLYQAVARVLAYVYQLRRYRGSGGAPPPPLDAGSLPVPADAAQDARRTVRPRGEGGRATS